MGDINGKKISHVQVVEHLNVDEYGVVTSSSQTSISKFEKEPPYVKLYLQDLARLNGLNTTEQKLVNELVYNMGYNNIVPAYKPVKEMIAIKLGVAYCTIDEAIKSLHKKGILIRRARGMYVMDPNIFGRGSWKDVKNIRLTIDYLPDGTKQINTEISKQLGLFDANTNE
jgi:hypothetical protein